LDSGILARIPHIHELFLNNPVIMKYMVALVNNLCYKNFKNKEVLGTDGYIEYCVSAFRRWSGKDFNAITTTQALKTIGNLSAHFPNSIEIVN